MPISFGISAEGLLRSKVVAPGVYLLNIKNITSGPGKNDPSSTTVTIDFTIKDGPNAAGQGAIGVPLRYWLSEKADGLAVGFIEAVTGKKVPQTGAQIPDLTQFIGRDVSGYIKNGMYNGKPQNQIDGFVSKAV